MDHGAILHEPRQAQSRGRVHRQIRSIDQAQNDSSARRVPDDAAEQIDGYRVATRPGYGSANEPSKSESPSTVFEC